MQKKVLTIQNDVPIRKLEGVFSYIATQDILSEYGIDLKTLYGRDNLCLKIFKLEVQMDDLDGFLWGDPIRNPQSTASLLTECSIIQNLFAYYGKIAPRVYDIILLSGKHKRLAQVTDFIKGEIGITQEIRTQIAAMSSRFKLDKTMDPAAKNYIDGKLVDFQPYSFMDKDQYREELIIKGNTICDWGSRQGEVYQSIPELGVFGQRDTQHRIQQMGFDGLNFYNKTVVDFGCNIGTMCREVLRRGAKRVVALDTKDVIDVAFEVCNYLGFFNIDYFGMDAKSELHKIKETFDVVLFLSVSHQIGYTPAIGAMCDEFLILEGHSADHDYTYMDILKKDFNTVECIGRTIDHSPRPLFLCRK